MMMADITYRLKREEQRKETRMKENIDTHQEEQTIVKVDKNVRNAI